MELPELVKLIRQASYDYWQGQKTWGCDSRSLAPAKYIATALIAAGAIKDPDQQ